MKMYTLILCMLLLTACGQTYGDVISEFQPQYQEMRVKLHQIAASIPDSADRQSVTGTLDPQPQYKEWVHDSGIDVISNTDIVMYQELLNPDQNLRRNGEFDLMLSNYLLYYLRWTDPNNPGEGVNRRAPKDFRQELQKVLQIKYLGVARTIAYKPVSYFVDSTHYLDDDHVMIDGHFEDGFVIIDGYLIDMDSQNILCSFRISAKNSEDFDTSQTEHRRLRTLNTNSENFSYSLDTEEANSNLWSNARNKFINTIGEVCGGEFSHNI